MKKTKFPRPSIKMVMAVTAALMGVLVFVSTTIFSHHLVRVTAAMPHQGHLQQMAVTQGTAVNARYIELVSGIAGIVSEVFVEPGQSVSTGEALLSLDFRGADTDLHHRIDTLQAQFSEQQATIALNRQRQQVEMTRVQTNIAHVDQQIDNLHHETIRTDHVSDFELRSAQDELSNAQHDLAVQEQLLRAGAVPAQAVRTAESRVQTATERVAHQQRLYEENHQRRQDSVADQQAQLDRQLESLAHQRGLLEQELQTRLLDVEALTLQETTARGDRDRRLADYQRQLAHFDQHRVLTAPVAGIMAELSVNQGAHLSANQRIATIGQGLVIQATVPPSDSFVTVGSTAHMHSTNHTLMGTVTHAHLTETGTQLTLSVEESVSLGERFTLQFEAVSGEAFTLVPNTAINRGSDGYFVNQVRRRDGVMGSEFFTEQVPVYLGESDGQHTAVLRGITFFQPLVVASSRPFTAGETVELSNQEDFFAN